LIGKEGNQEKEFKI